MQKALFLFVLLGVSLLAAYSNYDDRTSTDDSADRTVDQTEDTATDDAAASDDAARDTTSDDSSARDAARDEQRDARTDRMENAQTHRERVDRVRDRCTVAATDRERELCQRDADRLERLNCDEMDDETERDLCVHRGRSYEARSQVRYRHELNEECRELTGDDRAQCERRVNRQFQESVRDRWQAWKEEHGNVTAEERAAAQERLEALRERLREAHAEKKEEIHARLEERQQHLLDRLDNALAHMGRWSEKMQHVIDRASEAGHDTDELEFLLDEFEQRLDDAKVSMDNEEYRDAVASLKEARQVAMKFRDTLHGLVQAHREDRVYAVDENAFEDTEGDEE